MAETVNDSRIPYLYEAVRCGTVRAAADFLDVAPSAVSRQITLLEEELATPLMERHTRGIKPTEAGALLIEYYREQRSHQSDLLAKLQEIRGLRRGTVSVTMGEGFVSAMVSGPIMEFVRAYPEISVSVDIVSTNDVIRKVAEDDAEIGLVFNPPPDAKIVSRARQHAPLHAIVGPAFPLLGKVTSVTLKDLLPYPAALMYEAFGTRQLIDAASMLDKLRLTPAITTNSVTVLKRFVQSGPGFTLLSPLSIAAELAAGELAAIPVDNALLQNSEAHVVTRVGRQSSPAANRLLQHIASQMRR
jgi:DNA-binding transcriptional LysR family regulator